MWKLALAGTTALAVLGSAPAWAEQQTPAAGTEHTTEHAQHWRFSEQDFQAFTDARIAAIKAGLKLTPEQEKNWPAVEQAIRDFAKVRHEHRLEHRRDQQGTDAMERLRERAAALGQTAEGLKRLAAAADPLYQSLTPDQKHRMGVLVRSMRGHHVAMHGREHHGFDRD